VDDEAANSAEPRSKAAKVAGFVCPSAKAQMPRWPGKLATRTGLGFERNLLLFLEVQIRALPVKLQRRPRELWASKRSVRAASSVGRHATLNRVLHAAERQQEEHRVMVAPQSRGAISIARCKLRSADATEPRGPCVAFQEKFRQSFPAWLGLGAVRYRTCVASITNSEA
jgi:hypothetical protein